MMNSNPNNTKPIYEVIRNKYLFTKIVHSLDGDNSAKPIDIRSGSDNIVGWRFKYQHYSKLSDLLNFGSNFNSLILDKVKTQSIIITNNCIKQLVASNSFDSNLFESIYHLKQWMFVDDDLLFHAVESGCLQRVKLLANQTTPITLQRTNAKKLSIQNHAWICLQFDIYHYLVKEVKDDNGNDLSDIPAKVKATPLLNSIEKLKDLEFFEKIIDSTESSDGESAALYQLKMELIKGNPYKTSKQLIVKQNGLRVIRKMLPKFVFDLEMVDYFFKKSSFDSWPECSEYPLQVLDEISRDVYKWEFGLNLEMMRLEVKKSLREANEELKSRLIYLEESVLENQRVLEHYVLITQCIKKIYNNSGRSLLYSQSFRELNVKLIQASGLLGLPLFFRFGSSSYQQSVEVFKYGTLEQIKYSKNVSSGWLEHHLQTLWVEASLVNPDPSGFTYLVEEYGYEALASRVNQFMVLRMKLDTPERLQLLYALAPDLSQVVPNYTLNASSMTEEFVEKLVGSLMKLSSNLNTSSNIFMELQYIAYYMNKVDLFKKIVSSFGKFNLERLLGAAIRSLHYDFVSFILDYDNDLIDKIIGIAGEVGDLYILKIITDKFKLSTYHLHNLIDSALVYSQFEIIDKCLEQYPKETTDLLAELVVSKIDLGKLDIIKYYLQHFPPPPTTTTTTTTTTFNSILVKSVSTGQFEIFKYLMEVVTNENFKENICNTLFSSKVIRPLLNTKRSVPMLRHAVDNGFKFEITDKIKHSIQRKSKYIISIFELYDAKLSLSC